MFESMNEFREKILLLRAERKLHGIAENMIVELFHQNFPSSFVIPESAKRSKGHRADVIVHLPEDKVVHFEIFADPSTVSRDINSLENSTADFQMAIILDDIDKRVVDSYFHELDSRKIPYQFWPRFQLSDLLVRTKQVQFIEKVKQIIYRKRRKIVELNELRLPAEEWYVARKESEKEVKDVFRILRRRKPPSLFVTGPRGIGKSSFLNKIQNIALEQGFLTVKREVVDEDWSRFIAELEKDVQNIIRMRSELDYVFEHRTAAPTEILVESIQELLNRLNKPLVFIIDQFERLFERGEMKLTEVEIDRIWNGFTRMLARFNESQRILWVIAARQQYYFLMFSRFGSLREYDFSYVSIPTLSRKESEHLVNKISKLTVYPLTPKTKGILLDNCVAHPQYIILSFINLCTGKSMNTLIGEQEVMEIRPWLDVFEKDLEKLRTQEERMIIYAMAHTQKEICTFEEIQSRMATRFRISENDLRDRLRHIQNDLLLIRQPKYDVFEFYHPVFADYIREKYVANFPEEWDTQRLVELALYMCREEGFWGDGEYGPWVIASEYLSKALCFSSEYKWAVDKAIKMVLDKALARWKRGNELPKCVAYHDSSLFLEEIINDYKHRAKPVDEELYGCLKDKLVDLLEKYCLGFFWVRQKVSSLCTCAVALREHFKDDERAERLIEIATKVTNEEFSNLEKGEFLDIPPECGDIMASFGRRKEADKIYKNARLLAETLARKALKARKSDVKAQLFKEAGYLMMRINKENAKEMFNNAVDALRSYRNAVKQRKVTAKDLAKIEQDIYSLRDIIKEL